MFLLPAHFPFPYMCLRVLFFFFFYFSYLQPFLCNLLSVTIPRAQPFVAPFLTLLPGEGVAPFPFSFVKCSNSPSLPTLSQYLVFFLLPRLATPLLIYPNSPDWYFGFAPQPFRSPIHILLLAASPPLALPP